MHHRVLASLCLCAAPQGVQHLHNAHALPLQVKHVLMQHLQLLPPPINATGGAPGGSTAAAASGAAALWAECDAAVERDVSTRAGAAASAALAAETRAAAGGSESGKHKRSLSQGQLLLGSGGASGGMEGGVVGGSSGDNSRHGGSTAEDMLDINQVGVRVNREKPCEASGSHQVGVRGLLRSLHVGLSRRVFVKACGTVSSDVP